MAKGDSLGEFELLVLAALQRLGSDAYGSSIRAEIEQRARRFTSIGAVHATLSRLAEKEYVVFHFSDPLPVPGGKSRKMARVTPAGRRAFQQATAAMLRMIDGLTAEPRQ